jgi:hypothetical protein
MQLNERLAQLVGHEVFVTTQIQNEDSDIPGGTLQEVGVDYLVVKTEDEERGGHAIIGAEWLITLAPVVAITHGSDCPKCAVDFANSLMPPNTPAQ